MKIAVIGTGHLGKIHLKCLNQIPEYQVIGFYDQNDDIRHEISEEYGVVSWSNLDDLIQAADVVDIVTPTPTHAGIARQCLLAGKHVFIEKPVTETPEEALALIELQKKLPHLKIQVGHVERFNPAIQALDKIQLDPRFIEVHRLAQFNPRGTDVSVILDLMIHDLDILLTLVQGEVKHVIADGINIISDSEDICNARIEWDNGCVANVTASRISIKNMRKLRIFQSDAYVGIDFLQKETQIIRLLNEKPEDDEQVLTLDSPKGKKYVHIDMPESKPSNAILEELTSFYHCIQNDHSPRVSLEEATRALQLAAQIVDVVQKRNKNR